MDLLSIPLYVAVTVYVTRFVKTRHNDAFLETQIFASMNSIYLNLCSVVISMQILFEIQG